MLALSSVRGILPDDAPDPLFVLGTIFLEHVVGVGLGGRVGVGVVQEILDAEQDLLDSDGGLPALLLVQDR